MIWLIGMLFGGGASVCFWRSLRHIRRAGEVEALGHHQGGQWLRISGVLEAGAGVFLLFVGFLVWRMF